MDLGFYAFDLPFYRLVLSYLFVATFLAFIANLLGHYLFGGIRLAGRTGALSRSARIQLVTLVGTLVLLKAFAYWLDRYELLSHTRGGKPFTGAGYTDINAVLPAKLILLAIAVICAVAVFSAIVLRDLRIPAIGVVLLLLSLADRRCGLAADRRAVQRQTQCRAEGKRIHQSQHHRDQAGLRPDRPERAPTATTAATRRPPPSRWPPTGRRRRTSGCSTRPSSAPAFTQFQQGKNFYFFPDQLSIDRYNGPDGNLRDYVVAARELNPDRLIDNQRDWINRHTVYTHGNGFIASPANTVRGVANDPNQNGGYPEFLASVVGANGSVVSPGSGAAGSAAHLLRPGHRQHGRGLRDRRQERHRPRVRLRDQHRDQELHLRRQRRRAGRQLAGAQRVRRQVRRAKLPVLQRDRRPTARSCSTAIRPSASRRWRRG